MDNNNKLDKVVYLRLDDIIPNRFQPREVFDETGLEELAESIKEHGIIQPIIVRQLGDKYELIAGERRSKASAIAGLTTIPAIIRNMDDKESAKVSLLENLQRKNLSAIEEARTYKRILELDNMTQDDLAKTMGKSQPLIANKLRLLSLPEEIQDALIKNQISERHARSLLNIKDKKQQLMLLDRIRNERLTVRELDQEIKKIKESEDSSIEANNPNSRQAFNTFNEQPIQPKPVVNQFNTDYQNSFGNMGLDDYRSQVSNNMFNNQSTNYSNINSQFSNLSVDNLTKPQEETNQFDYNDFSFNNKSTMTEISKPDPKESKLDFQYPENYSIPEKTDDIDYSSLGSMFDTQSSSDFSNNLMSSNEFDNKDIFVSNIKENEIQKQGNQFLPNFDDMPLDNNGQPLTNEFQSNSMMNNNILNNEFNAFSQDNYNLSNNSYSSFNNDFMINNDTNHEIKDSGQSLSIGYSENQGNLFNQPLNIVDVKNTEYEANMDMQSNDDVVPEKTNLEQNDLEINNSDIPFDNPFDDPYESILFAKPVPIQIDEKVSKEEVEVIGEEETSNNYSEIQQEDAKEENQYISLDPVRTIFDTRQAVLELKKTTDRIKQNNINIETEEIDFDDFYQIVIKIKKEQ